MSGFNWICPHCHHAQTVVSSATDHFERRFWQSIGADGPIGLMGHCIVCANPDCRRATVSVGVMPYTEFENGNVSEDSTGSPIVFQRLIPKGSAKPFPDYVPLAIRQDYAEACLIRDLSPKASATLARRCLQGMVRDFGKVKPSTLFKEIGALEKAVEDGSGPRGVSADSIEALTALRKVGNIGAHMEADVNVIVDVDANEAQVLIDLIESLIDDWYVETRKRQQRFAKAVALGQEKAAQLKDAKAGQSALPAPHSDDG